MRPPFRLIDGHAHLNELDDAGTALAEARDAGVRAIIGVGMDVPSNRAILALAAAHPSFVFPAIGYHPWEIRGEEIEETLAFLEAHIHECVAVGEVGLDYKAKVKKPRQRAVFERVIDLAVQSDKPLILHCRYSHARALAMILEGGVKRAVFHWYTGSLELLDEILAAGYCISATPALRYSSPHREAVRHAPLDRILIETDCPVEYEGIRSRPRDVLTTAREVAEIQGVSLAEAANLTSRNAVDFYRLSGPGGETTGGLHHTGRAGDDAPP